MIRWFFETDGFMPRKECGDWPDWLVTIAIISNLLIGLAYYAIPLTLYTLYKKRASEIPKSRILVFFSAFIFACGTTHILDASMYFWPAYRLLILSDVFTACISVYTAIILPKTVSFLMKQQSMTRLIGLNEQLQREVEARTKMEKDVRELNHDLAGEVQRLQNVVAVQGWIAEKQMDLEAMKKIITDLRKQYARPNQTSP
jgi:hypothetical protein